MLLMKTLSVFFFFQIIIGLGGDRSFFLKRNEWGLGESKAAAHPPLRWDLPSGFLVVRNALKKNIQNGADWQWSGVDSGVIFELHRIVLLLFFLVDAAKTSPQAQNMRPLFVCRIKRNMKWAETLQTFCKLTEIYWDLRPKVSVSWRTMIWFYFEDWFN